MTATLVVRHSDNDYATWRPVYDELDALRVEHGCTDQRVLASPANANDLMITHDFPTVEQASAFAHDPALLEGMQRAGVAGEPSIEIFEGV